MTYNSRSPVLSQRSFQFCALPAQSSVKNASASSGHFMKPSKKKVAYQGSYDSNKKTYHLLSPASAIKKLHLTRTKSLDSHTLSDEDGQPLQKDNPMDSHLRLVDLTDDRYLMFHSSYLSLL